MQESKNQSEPTSDPKISEKDLTLLENIIKEWYTNNSDKLFASKNSNIMKYMRNISKELDSFRKFTSPTYLYRGISFENDKIKDQAMKKMKEHKKAARKDWNKSNKRFREAFLKEHPEHIKEYDRIYKFGKHEYWGIGTLEVLP
jgi:hypothetical protein